MAGPWGSVSGLGAMFPYAATAMDYAVAAGGFHARQSPVNQAFTHSCILELRKEKSRDAARSRRGKENYEFYELAKMLPLPPAITSQLDKASIIRLTISFLRLKDYSAHGDPQWVKETTQVPGKKGGRSRSLGNATLDLFEQHIGTHILQSLDGFAFSLAADGRFLYISETVSIYLGLSQVEMTGSSVFDYIHQGDHSELAEQLGLGLAHGPGANVPSPASDDGSTNSATNNPDVSSLMSISSNLGYKGMDRAFCIRMKSTLTKRGCHFKSSGYRVVLVLCRLRPQYSVSNTRKSQPYLLGMSALAIALPPPSVHEIRLETDMFVTRLAFDFKMVHCEPRVAELLDYTAEELTGRNLYSICHAEDVNQLRKCHVDLLAKGQVMSHYYRVMNKNGGYTWIQSCATVVCSSKNAEEQTIICVNYVISGCQFSHVVMDCCQLDSDYLSVVKTELVDQPDRKTPDQNSTDVSRLDRHESDLGVTNNKWAPNVPPRVVEGKSPAPVFGSRLEPKTNLAQRPTSAHDKVQLASPERRPSPVRAELASKLVLDPAIYQSQSAKSKGKRKGERNRKRSTPSDQPHTEDNHSWNCKRKVIVTSDSPLASEESDEAKKRVRSSPGPHHHHSNPESVDNHLESGRWKKAQPGQWDTAGASSVKDLEHIMSKHLPARSGDSASQSTTGIDFSTDSLLRQQSCGRGGSAIQWVGTKSQPSSGLPVSALLRQLCASRESVIRANVQATLAAARGTSSYYPDISTVQSALPTPPGSDNYPDQFMLANHHTTNHQITTEFSSLVPYPPTSSYDYQPSMTPPGSVSPRDKLPYSLPSEQTPCGESLPSNASFRPPHSYVEGPAQPLALKPHVYGYHPHAGLDPQYPLGDHSQSQFYPPSHSSFHLYHSSSKSNPYTDALKSSNWYSITP